MTKWCSKFNKRTGTCPHGCTWRNFACHRYSRKKTCMETPCPYVHVEPQCDADDPFGCTWRNAAGARHRSRSPRPKPRPKPPARAPAPPAPSPRTCEALLLIGIDPNEAGITKGMIGTNYRREMREWHPDKLEAILRSKTQQLANAKEHLDKVYP